jgi:SAM-dependent methyltransferase
VLTPSRRRGVEILDDPATDSVVRERSIGDVTRSNRWLGGLRSAVLEARAVLPRLGASATLLDVGTGLADIPRQLSVEASARGRSLTTIGIDGVPSLVAAARRHVSYAVCARAHALPFADRSVDVVLCSQLLHHFDTADAEALIRELNRVARHAVIISDLRRSWIAAAGFWLVSFPFRFHPVTRHDGVVSVLRGFTSGELTQLIRSAVGVAPHVQRRLGFRLTVHWTPTQGT